MLKKVLLLTLCLIMMIMCVSCGDTKTESADTTAAQNQETKAENTTASDVKATESNGKYDLDLTTLSSTMVYSEVYNMMMEPQKYEGKYVRMHGPFAVYEGDSRNYYACIIADATACCSQGIEFVLKDTALSYPNDYPELGDEIVVSGNFTTYFEGENMYCELVDAVIE